MLKIVNSSGETMKLGSTVMEFESSERDRAEAILFLVELNATNGPFQLVEANGNPRSDAPSVLIADMEAFSAPPSEWVPAKAVREWIGVLKKMWPKKVS